MSIRKAHATWKGDVKDGQGVISLGDDKLQVRYGFTSRFEDGAGSNPEELVGGAHAGCFSMALAHALDEAGHQPVRISTTARVHLEESDGGFSIPRIDLETEAEVPGIDDRAFQVIAEDAKKNCPLSKVLSGAEIALEAQLIDNQ
jgi:osmotically inducible protein OsmC